MAVFKIAILGLVHDHIWIFYQDDIREIPDAKIIAAADPNQELLDKAHTVFGIDKGSLYSDYQAMVDQEKPDACLVFAPSSEHAELTKMCAKRGIHVMVEKPMAATYDQARSMVRAATENSTRLMINYPIAHKANTCGLIRMMRSGELGKIWMFRWRMGHSGAENQSELTPYFLDWLFDPEKNGGGALADFCTYGAALLTSALGQPQAVTAMAGNLLKQEQRAEDNGVVTVQYDGEHRAIAILEGTWSQVVGGSNNCIFGDQGAVVTSPLSPGAYHQRMKDDKQWQEISFPERPEIEDKAVKYFVHRVRENLPFEGMVNPENALFAQEIIEAAYISIREARTVALPL